MNNEVIKKIYSIINVLQDRDFEFNLDLDEDTYEIHLFSKEDFSEGQIGYRMDEKGNSLIYPEGDWEENWYVIGFEELLGDPIIVDSNDSMLPVFTLPHDGEWSPIILSPSLKSFIGNK